MSKRSWYYPSQERKISENQTIPNTPPKNIKTYSPPPSPLFPLPCSLPSTARRFLATPIIKSMASLLSSPIFLKKRKKKRTTDSLSDLKTLGHQLLSSRAHINNLPLLLTFISPSSPPAHVLESLLSLQSFFTPLLPDLPAASSSKTPSKTQVDDPEFIYRTWLRSKFDEFVTLLIDVSVSEEAEGALKVCLFCLIIFRFSASLKHMWRYSMFSLLLFEFRRSCWIR